MPSKNSHTTAAQKPTLSKTGAVAIAETSPKRKGLPLRAARVVKRSVRQALGSQTDQAHQLFYPLLGLCFAVWMIYRALFQFPVWFDETIGKAVFFGLPVWLYVVVSDSMSVVDTFAANKLRRGLLLGLALGGMYGFTASFASALLTQAKVEAVPLFASSDFWQEFLLSLLTGFWETLFFYSWVMVVIQEKYATWATWKQVGLVALVFLLFHVPNTLRYFSGSYLVIQLGLLTLFALGQALLFARRRNAYALAVSHAIWGMALLVHVR